MFSSNIQGRIEWLYVYVDAIGVGSASGLIQQHGV